MSKEKSKENQMELIPVYFFFLQKVKTDAALLTYKLSTKDESDMSIYSALTKPALQGKFI